MTTIAIRFSGGRYHATPWGSHVNEGLVEWPPGPWRILRAMLAVGFSKLGWQEVPDDAVALFHSLAAVLPEYRLPRGELAHTRHYMPIQDGRKETTTKVLDTRVCLRNQDELLIRYAVDLTQAQNALLSEIVQGLGYLGRAESWTEAELRGDVEEPGPWCRPSGAIGLLPPGADQVALLAPVSSEEYLGWRATATNVVLERETEKRGGKLTNAQREKALVPYPADLIACLSSDTAFLQRHGWSQPPGSRRVLYDRPPRTLEPQPVRAPSREKRSRTFESALLALSADTRRGTMRPLMTRCVRQAEFIHEALVSILAKQGVTDCPSLIGRDANRASLATGHQHVHYVPLDLDQDGRLDHFLLYAPMGLDPHAQRAITQLRQTWGKDLPDPIVVTCAGFGDLDLFRRQLRTRDGQIPAALRERATVWSSFTPYVPARHLKPKNRRYTIEDDVCRELHLRCLSNPKEIELFNQTGSEGRNELIERQLLKFVRTRREGKPQPPIPVLFGMRITFDEPVSGPLMLGYASHFGMGLFGAEEVS